MANVCFNVNAVGRPRPNSKGRSPLRLLASSSPWPAIPTTAALHFLRAVYKTAGTFEKIERLLHECLVAKTSADTADNELDLAEDFYNIWQDVV